MKKDKKEKNKSFGRSFKNAYLSTTNMNLSKGLLSFEVPEKSKKKIPKIAGVSDPVLRKKLENQLAQSVKLASIGTLTSGITNEINNPLAGIMGYAEIMIDEENPPKIKKYAEKIILEAKRASEIVKWITRYSQEAKDNEKSSLYLENILNESIVVLRHSRNSNDIKIIKDFWSRF